MNEATEKLIRELAEKFGTTAEHLWGVMVKQAVIGGAIDLLMNLAAVAALVWAFRLVRRKTSTPPPTAADKYPDAEWEEEGAVLAWVLWGISALVALPVVTTCVAGAVKAMVNPEYWALSRLLP